jgi:hypothetical protein
MGGDVVELARRFVNAKASRPAGVYGPLLIRLLAAFERYLRSLVVQSVNQRASRALTYDDLSATLARRNLILTARVLLAADTPLDHLKLDVDSLICNLASCKRGSSSYRLNADAFSATVTGSAPPIIERAMQQVDVSNLWDGLGASPPLAKLLQTRGARATGARAYERLRELCRWRNQLAHGGDDEIALTEVQLRDAIDFVGLFSAALDATVAKRLGGS